MTRWIFFLLFGVLLSGCMLLIPEQKELPPPVEVSDQQDFDQILDVFLATGDPAGLDQYLVDYPHGDHHTRAQALSLFAHELQQCRNQSAELMSSDRSRLETIAALEEKNRLLHETIEQLKSLLIQLEQRVQ